MEALYTVLVRMPQDDVAAAPSRGSMEGWRRSKWRSGCFSCAQLEPTDRVLVMCLRLRCAESIYS
jgi:hypothetical protein